MNFKCLIINLLVTISITYPFNIDKNSKSVTFIQPPFLEKYGKIKRNNSKMFTGKNISTFFGYDILNYER